VSAPILHVAALPFPSHQGTQAALFSMLSCSVAAERDAHLLTYASAPSPTRREPAFALHEASKWPRLAQLSPTRSGPSLGKLVLDVSLGGTLRKLERQLRPRAIVAHHVEAAALALTLTRTPVVFFAHTDLAAELPTYGSVHTAAVAARCGARLDAWLAARADAVAVISPSLRERFAERIGAAHAVQYVPTPWPTQMPGTADERARARQQLQLARDAEVLLYAGNLDRYQGIDTLLAAVAKLAARRPRLALLVATESTSSALRAQAHAAGLAARIRIAPLAGEAARRAVHAAADLAVVPRLAPGGLPIKLLDALSRALPCVAVPRASAGLALQGAVELAVRDDDAEALALAIAHVLSWPARRSELAASGPRYVASQHAPTQFLAGLDRALSRATRARSAAFHVPEIAAS
jgi:glycosyltransferase involved in cell wall biosynthesis